MGSRKGMKVITVNIPMVYLEHIKKLIKGKITPSTSEYVRWSIGNQITRDSETNRYMEELAGIEPEKVKVPKDYTYIKGFNGNKPFKTVRLEEPEEKRLYY